MKTKIDWNFVLNWSVSFTIFWFGISCMTARDFAAKDYFLAALDGRQVDWNSVQHAIVVKIIGGTFISLMIFLLAFVVLILWSYFLRKTPSYSESQLREKTKPFLTALLGATVAVGLMFFYYVVVDNKGYMLAVEGMVVIALAYFIKSKENLFACYVLLAIFIYLLVKYTVSVEGTRLMIVFLYTVATCTWSISCLLWKTQPLFGTQQSLRTVDSNASAATNRAMEDKFYKIAFDEITINKVEPTLWAKAFAHAEGNEDKAKALYVKYRAEQLNTLKTQSSQVTADDIDITDQPKSNIWVELYTDKKKIITVATIIGLVGVGLLVSQLQKISMSSSKISLSPSSNNIAESTQEKQQPEKDEIQEWVDRGEAYFSDKDYKQAIYWLKKAADKDNVVAQNRLGDIYGSGIYGGPVDHNEAVRWLRKAAEQGYAPAQYNLSLRYSSGFGVPQDNVESIRWLRKAAEQGYIDAQRSLGVSLLLREDIVESIRWLRKAAEQNDALSQFFLCSEYFDGGDGISQDYAQAAYWCRKAADQNFFPSAQFLLGVLYDKGDGVSQDYAQAAYWYRKAADQNFPNAQFHLGVLYGKGDGVSQDYAQAAYWYRKAADQNHPRAQCNLGVSYLNGEGVSQDNVNGLMWIYICYKNSEGTRFQDYASRAFAMTHKLNIPDYQINQAQQRATSWLAAHLNKK